MRIRHLCARAALGLASIFLAGFAASAPASASLLITVDKSAQQMTVSENGVRLYTWPVSTGVEGHDTPGGAFTPFRMEKDHFSKEWDDAPMPNSIFFTKQGHAIHGSFHKSIGQPASHGCVRLSPRNAETLFALVKDEGMANTRVVLTGEIPPAGAAVARRQLPRQNVDYDRTYATGTYDDEYSASARRQRVVGGWRESNDGPRYYYYREQPSAERRVYRSPSPFPFGW